MEHMSGETVKRLKRPWYIIITGTNNRDESCMVSFMHDTNIPSNVDPIAWDRARNSGLTTYKWEAIPYRPMMWDEGEFVIDLELDEMYEPVKEDTQ